MFWEKDCIWPLFAIRGMQQFPINSLFLASELAAFSCYRNANQSWHDNMWVNILFSSTVWLLKHVHRSKFWIKKQCSIAPCTVHMCSCAAALITPQMSFALSHLHSSPACSLASGKMDRCPKCSRIIEWSAILTTQPETARPVYLSFTVQTVPLLGHAWLR